jgi:hypothetical protein
MTAFEPGRSSSAAVRALFAARSLLGALLGLDRPATGLGARAPTLRHRLPADLREGPAGPPGSDGLPFRPLYLTGDEWALEIANQTVHGVVHLGWVADGTGGHSGRLAVLVKPNGLLGRSYMAAIAPWRHRIVYPVLLRDIGRAWRRPEAPAASAVHYGPASRSGADGRPATRP